MSPNNDQKADPNSVAKTPSVEERWHRAYQELSFHVENTPLAVIEWDRGTHIARWSNQAERLFGWSAAEVIGKAVTDWRFVVEDDLPLVQKLVQEMTEDHKGRGVIQNRNYTKSGTIVWSQWHNSLLQDDAGQVLSVLSLVIDITERKKAEEELVRSEARLRAALRSAQMMGWDWDLTTRKSYFSTDYAAFYGLPADRDYSIDGNGWLAVHPDDIPRVERTLSEATTSGEDLAFEYRGRVPRADGEIRWFITRGQVIRGPDGKLARVVAITTDITDRKRAERERAALDHQLLDAQKWESLGVLAGGIAHDFNNILTVILGCAGLARKVLPPGSPAGPLLDQVDEASRRAGQLCKQMLAYAGKGNPVSGRTDLNVLIRETAPLLDVPASRHAHIKYELVDVLLPILAEAAQVRQVLVSLVMNAAEALAEPGGVTVRTRMETVANPTSAGFRLAPTMGQFAVMEVSDTGSGMTDEVKAKMFDPFFTTKFPGRGLGLSAVLGIVRAHRGAIAVQSSQGNGTTVSVYWPFDTSTVPGGSKNEAVKSAAVSPVAEKLIALIADDEMYVREVAASTLEDLGYQPVLAGDGVAAMALFHQHQANVRIAVIDVVMPGMSGEKVLESLRALAPGLPVVLISGYTDRRVIAADARTVFLQKPFHPEELTAVVQKLAALPTSR